MRHKNSGTVHIFLACAARDFYVAYMKFAAATLFVFSLMYSVLTAQAQSIQVDAEEFRRLQGEVADLRDGRLADSRKISELTRKVEQLQSSMRSAEERTTLKLEDSVTRDDLKKILDRVSEVDHQRESDKKVILEEVGKLAAALSRPTPKTPKVQRNGGDESTTRSEAKEEKIEGEFYPHKVQSGETFGEILQAYNAALKNDGRKPVTTTEVQKVNPKINLNRIRVGQEILLPVPPKK